MVSFPAQSSPVHLNTTNATHPNHTRIVHIHFSHPMPFLHSIFLLVYLHLLGIFANVGVDSFFDEFASAACDLQYEIVEGHASEDVYVVRFKP
jgi:hypothetical protein